MSDNFEGLVNVLPNIGAAWPDMLSVKGITGPSSLLNAIFPNAEEMLNSPWWAKFFENYLLKSPVKALLQDLNLNLFHKDFWSRPVPSIINLDKNQGRSR